ncbi:MAG: aspartate carbamoyltransferase [Filifactoraceae bacterium]
MKNLISVRDLSQEDISKLISLSESIINSPEDYCNSMKGKILATLFYEPSTRTRLSFEAAMLRLGGQVIGFSEADNSSVSKGETIQDTCITASCYSDIIAMRSPVEGSQLRASEVLTIPIINAGDGGHQHPTQTLTDLLTIKSELKRLENLNIMMVGDLKYGRTVHSLVEAMSKYRGNSFIFVSPEELKMPSYVKKSLEKSTYCETTSFEKYIGKADIIYMTRVQKERFDNSEQYERLKDSYILDEKKMSLGKVDMIVMHPLPRVNEIAVAVDKDPRAAYFRQMKNGMYMRMALIKTMVEGYQGAVEKENHRIIKGPCSNPKCVVNFEDIGQGERVDRGNGYVCKYCDK